mmetsp:Transcript_26724/g.83283  ORF Transcript_26724/g.83283 Transcript_26724/m.83283 type:complete len:205 (+) Transcript_26724:328-942(+)
MQPRALRHLSAAAVLLCVPRVRAGAAARIRTPAAARARRPPPELEAGARAVPGQSRQLGNLPRQRSDIGLGRGRHHLCQRGLRGGDPLGRVASVVRLGLQTQGVGRDWVEHLGRHHAYEEALVPTPLAVGHVNVGHLVEGAAGAADLNWAGKERLEKVLLELLFNRAKRPELLCLPEARPREQGRPGELIRLVRDADLRGGTAG